MVETLPIADTHEHLVEEKARFEDPQLQRGVPALFGNYIESDIQVAGMPEEKWKAIFEIQNDPEKFWKELQPVFSVIQNTSYGQMVRESLQVLLGEEDLTDKNLLSIDEKLRRMLQPGFYQKILKELCNIDHCQVNALDIPVFRETEMPDLLLQDISSVCLTSDFNPEVVQNIIGRPPQSLDDGIEAIDRTFQIYGNRAIAVKNQSAYRRKLDYERWPRKEVESCFRKCAEKNWKVEPEERKPVEDFLFHHSLDRATEYGLPVKLHTGYHAGHKTMQLHHVRQNAGDMCRLCLEHPETKFVFMHITWPYQDEAIAVAKHYPNATIDMCWAWMLNPVAAIRFLKEFLVAVPSNKLLSFGGDVSYIELVPGLVRTARRGIAQAISQLVEEQWLPSQQVPDLLERILFKNAYSLFPVEDRKTKGSLDLKNS